MFLPEKRPLAKTVKRGLHSMKLLICVAVVSLVVVIMLLFSEKKKKKQKISVKKDVIPKGPSDAIERTPEIIPDPRFASARPLPAQVYPPRNGIGAQYSNPSLTLPKHPILEYQYSQTKGMWPANIGDPIRVQNIGGGAMGLYGEPSPFTESLLFSKGSIPISAGPKGREEDMIAGPGNRLEKYSGISNLVPVPAGAFKSTSGATGRPNFWFLPANFIGSVDVQAPFAEVNTPWEKIGIMTSLAPGGKESILNLYRRAIAPLQNLWEYQVQDKNGFIIKLREKELENGDVVPHITGKEGPWKVHDYNQNKYIWM